MDPRTGAPVGAPVPHTGPAALDATCRAAAGAAPVLAARPPHDRAAWLRAIATTLGDHADELIALADAETGLGPTRLTGELARTRGQLELFADAVTEGAILEVVIDPADPDAKPVPRPDLRRMLLPIGPVAVYAASNFPFAFSIAGGDTASALAAGAPVVVKAHPGHPGLAARCGQLIVDALAAAGAPAGTFAVVHGFAAGEALVQHPAIAAAGFTGSVAGGRALFDLAAARPDPIPFYGELGSLNPVVVTAGALATRANEIVSGLVGSFTLGTGQFCTKPGLVFLPAGHGLADQLRAAVAEVELGPVLNAKIEQGFEQAVGEVAAVPGVRSLLPEPPGETGPGHRVAARLLAVDAPTLVERSEQLLSECFGPAALLVEYANEEQLLAGLAVLPGSLTAAVHADADAEPELVHTVVDRLNWVAGRIIFDGWPTGVAVSWAMQHGGPWPATTHSGHTSVGVTAVRRFQRPVVYQNTPAQLLPLALRDENPFGLPRRVAGVLTLG
ncbi:aldehyde dehydrogenase (NADP(+)) [Natronosporangium hydrolyticum]|uniref:Aldehyde dehydrogenase (NADP(+)) n=1 Tax=Natronosporangium hydrolyticum TaxID=2811111 RepID=A0A895YID2_9ACTN|nr:aldehyde dehydrogenase (NADP(+)) [Natronosporangium hydrolyticum]